MRIDAVLSHNKSVRSLVLKLLFDEQKSCGGDVNKQYSLNTQRVNSNYYSRIFIVVHGNAIFKEQNKMIKTTFDCFFHMDWMMVELKLRAKIKSTVKLVEKRQSSWRRLPLRQTQSIQQ